MEDIKENLFQQAIYCGVPAANHAFALTRKVLESIAPGPGPRPQA
jgi:4-carboxymuconolactone decarboxylase